MSKQLYYTNGLQSLYLSWIDDFSITSARMVLGKTAHDDASATLMRINSLQPFLWEDSTIWLQIGDERNPDGGIIPAAWTLTDDLLHAGFQLRSDIIVVQNDKMPESVTSRPSHVYEHLLFFTLQSSDRFYYNAEAIAEPVTGNAHPRRKDLTPSPSQRAKGNAVGAYVDKKTRNRRDVWTVTGTPPTGELHPRVAQLAILAGSAEGDLIIDPWCQTGTTLVVAKALNRQAVGISHDPAMLEQAKQRLENLDDPEEFLAMTSNKPSIPKDEGWWDE